ncbi:site-specific integrase [Burkholderia ubonensis]|uniref:site-specific integrase n=1 Tax=Burkholderia ubonensis TaxID=101571 RepID=UPI00075B9F3B|nr:site-specific integrase [Burkholderia ubonensis]KVL65423.1 integrase [Burkholderia ubonensis]KVL76335.1 integrase [Burkholderia ubonensis]KVL92080.1 integrase [Burkholderia ubonensis]
MANRPQQLELPPPRTYSRTELTALRARVKGLPIATIARLYFDPDEHAPLDVERLLRTMRDDLVSIALREGSPVLKEHLQTSIRKHGEPRLTPVSLQLIEQVAGGWAKAAPAPGHAIARWFRPLVAQRLADVDVHTLGALVSYCNRRGGAWWRSVPRIGVGRARTVVAWLRRHADTLGDTVAVDVDPVDRLLAEPGARVALRRGQLVPIHRLAMPQELAGASGANRASAFPYIAAAHDLDAVFAYLHRYDGQAATQRAYWRELERFVLWCVLERGRPMSSMLVDDCDAYKAFLASPSDAFRGLRAPRGSGRWRPFSLEPLSLDSQRYAVRTLRAAFDWLVKVRYLAGNPWVAVADPKPLKRATALQVQRALPIDVWATVRTELAARSAGQGPRGPDWRIARALILLMGDAGLRIEEAVTVQRGGLQWWPADDATPATWLLRVVGKGHKERFVPVTDATIDALRDHWQDRGRDFDSGAAGLPLVAPTVVPPTPAGREKFGVTEAGEVTRVAGYTPRAARRVVTRALARLIEQLPGLAESARRQLARTSPHAFRHTFGTQSAAAGMALEVLQQVLGHASLQTTTIYVNAEQQRMRQEVAKYHARLAARRGE